MNDMVRPQITEELLDQIQSWAVRRFTAEEHEVFVHLVQELRRLQKRVAAKVQKGEQCAFIRTIGGHQFRCAALAKHGSFCGYHKPKARKQRTKGCLAKNRAGVACKAFVLRDDLCPTHWQKEFGHDYQRDGKGFRCRLCGAVFDYWAVEGKGRDRIGSIKRVERCPAKGDRQ